MKDINATKKDKWDKNKIGEKSEEWEMKGQGSLALPLTKIYLYILLIWLTKCLLDREEDEEED